MIPVMCRVGHYPERGEYGDCFRACVASILEVGSDMVPHFYENGETGDEAMTRFGAFLRPLGMAPFTCVYDGDGVTIDDILNVMMQQNRDTYYMLFGRASGGDHVVVCRGGTVAHDPAWLPTRMTECGSNGVWVVMVIARS